MKLRNVSEWIAIGANLGVLLGIILLILQLNQNRVIMKAEVRNELSTKVVEFLFTQATDPELAELMIKANNNETLSPAEQIMYGSRCEAAFRYWENVNYQYRQGLFDNTEYSAARRTMGIIINNNRGFKRFWCENKTLFSEPFGKEIDNILMDEKCE